MFAKSRFFSFIITSSLFEFIIQFGLSAATVSTTCIVSCFDPLGAYPSLHENFPNSHNESDGEVRELLRMFNYHIHHLEDIRRKRYNGSRFIFACEDEGIDISLQALEMFTVRRKYGELYMHYPHVGKHLLEVFVDNDVNVPDDHLICTNKMRNTLCGWFGDDQFVTPEEQNNLMMTLFMFYRQIMHKVPYKWKDPRLAIGYLPLGMLKNPEQDISFIKDNKYIHSWSCE